MLIYIIFCVASMRNLAKMAAITSTNAIACDIYFVFRSTAKVKAFYKR